MKKIHRVDNVVRLESIQKVQSYLEKHEQSVINELKKEYYRLNLEKSKQKDMISNLENSIKDLKMEI